MLVTLALVEPLPEGAGELPRLGSELLGVVPVVLVWLLFPPDPVFVLLMVEVVTPVVGLVEDEFTVVVVVPSGALVSVIAVVTSVPVLVSTVFD